MPPQQAITGSREDKCSSGMRIRDGGPSEKGLLCDGSRLGEELLCLWRFQAYGPSL